MDDGQGNSGAKSAQDDIQSKLDKKLGPEYISKRIGFGSSRVAYIEGWKAINLANQIFGYNGWSTEVKNVTVDFLDERQGKFCIGCTAIVRVSLADGTFREDIGYGTVENERRKASAFERAKKSAVTDALKRSLRGFGNALGNCLYDKDFLAKIDKVKFDPPDFDEGNLFRPADELSEITRSNTIADSHTEGPSLKKRILNHDPKNQSHVSIQKPGAPAVSSTASINQNRSTASGTIEAPSATNSTTAVAPVTTTAAVNPVSNEEAAQDPDDLLDDSFMFSDEIQEEDLINMNAKSNSGSTEEPRNTSPLTFVTAKAAESLQNKSPISSDAIFDPKFQAQSIRHTVDQSVSIPVRATVLKEKGIDTNKSKIYSSFAPKGKELSTNTTTEAQAATSQSSTETNKTTPTRYPAQLAPNTASNARPAAQRTQLGRPRMLQQPNIRKNIS
ncbi:DNA repair protein rad52 [Kluyveromyces marxianus]|nr:DNA repair protein rad52 [Kluyveromyces marxianus]KAG0682591.1 DNA repair protein rad52 [Kluyveromyces marxianus]